MQVWQVHDTEAGDNLFGRGRTFYVRFEQFGT
jgi:hypothetical protein